MVVATGFEPATPGPPVRCATGLRYAPISGTPRNDVTLYHAVRRLSRTPWPTCLKTCPRAWRSQRAGPRRYRSAPAHERTARQHGALREGTHLAADCDAPHQASSALDLPG